LDNSNKQKLTKNQQGLSTKHKIDFSEIWSVIHKAKALNKDRQIIRRFMQNTLKYPRKSPCPICFDHTISKNHIFFGCQTAKIVNSILQKLPSKWSSFTPPWSIEGVVKVLKSNTPLIQAIYISMLGILWRELNIKLYDDKDHKLTRKRLLDLLKDSLLKLTNLYFAKHRYALAKANAEDKPKLIRRFQKNWIDNHFTTISKNKIKINISPLLEN
jgi:hypothetical protein